MSDPVQSDQLQTGALCTLEDVARRVPGYDAGEDQEIDDVLSTLILQESVDYLDYTNREIITTADPDGEERLFDVDAFAAEERELAIGDATEILSVELRRADGTVVQTVDEASWVVLPRRRRQSWKPLGSIKFPRTVAAPAELPWPHRWGIHRETIDVIEMVAAVTGKWGFPEIPQPTRTGVATLVIIRYLTVADEGTPFADLANREDYNLGGWLKTALDFRERLRVPGSDE